MAKKVIAKFTGKGFKHQPDGKIEHDSRVLYLDRDAYLESENDQIHLEILNHFSNGIAHALRNKRLKPGSLRITFQLLDK